MSGIVFYQTSLVPADDDVTLVLFSEARGPRGMVYPPREPASHPVARPPYGPTDALAALEKALSLASRYDCGIAVADPDDCWRTGWGVLGERGLAGVD